MIRSASLYVLRFVASSFVLAVSATFVGSLFACVAVGQPQAMLPAAFLLALFVVFSLWPYLLGLGFWLAWFPPRRAVGWVVLLSFAFAAGLVASWQFQTVRPWDVYHEANGSMPGWEPVRMASLTSFISCLSAVASVVLSVYLVRRFSPAHHAA